MIRATTVLIGTIGGAIFYALSLPLAWLLGAMSICLVMTISGVTLEKPGLITKVMRALLGVAIGSAFSPELNERITEFAASLLCLIPYVVMVGVAGYYYFRKYAHFDPTTAFYAAMPGGFQDMTAMGEENGADTRQLALVHVTRIVALVFTLPFLATWLGDIEVLKGDTQWPGIVDLSILIGCGALGWWLAVKLKMSGAVIVGPMLVSAVVHYFGITEAMPPRLSLDIAQVIIGVHIGCQYQGVRLSDLLLTVRKTLVYLVILCSISMFFIVIVTQLFNADFVAALLAYSPGGQSEMNLIALTLNIDIAYVAMHHLVRMLIVIGCAQIVFGLLRDYIKE